MSANVSLKSLFQPTLIPVSAQPLSEAPLLQVTTQARRTLPSYTPDDVLVLQLFE